PAAEQAELLPGSDEGVLGERLRLFALPRHPQAARVDPIHVRRAEAVERGEVALLRAADEVRGVWVAAGARPRGVVRNTELHGASGSRLVANHAMRSIRLRPSEARACVPSRLPRRPAAARARTARRA